jgi:outer membrane protein
MKRIAGGALICALLATASAHAETFTLNDALAVAYETNPQLAAAQAQLRATDEGVAEADAGWRPTINAQGSYGVEQFGFAPITPNPIPGKTGALNSITEHPLQGELTVTQPVFRGGRTVAEIGRAKALVRAGRAQLTATEQTVLLDAVTAYMDVVRDTAIVNLRQKNVEVLTRQRDSTQAEFNAGSLTRTDVAQSQARLAGAQSDLTAAQGQLATSRANFMQIIGRPAETLETLPALPALPGSQDDVIGLASKQNPIIINAQENARAADYAIDDSYGALLPQLAVQGQYFYSQGSSGSFGSSSNPATNSGLGSSGPIHGTAVLGLLNVPIYQGGADEAQVRQTKELHSQATQNVEVANRQAIDQATSAWEGFQAAKATIESNQATEKADEIAFQGVSKEQQVGGRTILDVLNAEQELLNAQVAVVTAQRNTVVAAYQVLTATGALTAKALGLKVTLYDPVAHYDDDAHRWIGFGD